MSNLRRDARCLIRQREPIHYWQLCFPTLFNELHKVARHASRRTFRFLSKPVAPICERGHYNRAVSKLKKPTRIELDRIEQVRERGLRTLVQSKQRRGQAPLPDLFYLI